MLCLWHRLSGTKDVVITSLPTHDRGMPHNCLCECCFPTLWSSSHLGSRASRERLTPHALPSSLQTAHMVQTCFRCSSNAVYHGRFRVSLNPFTDTAKRQGPEPVNRTKQQHSFCFLTQVLFATNNHIVNSNLLSLEQFYIN